MKVDMIVLRHPNPGSAQFLAQNVNASVINAGDGTHEHPTQALLDAFSILEHYPKLEGLKIAIIGDIFHSRVALSNIFLLTKMGAEVTVCGPPTLIPKYIESLGAKVNYDLISTLKWCYVANVLRIQLERQSGGQLPSLREYNTVYGLTQKILNQLDKKILIMHPGPINRGVEIDSDVADGEHSIILNQVENGVAIRMSILYLLAMNHQNKLKT